MVMTMPQGGICHGQKEIFTEKEIPDCPGSPIRRKDNKPGIHSEIRVSIWKALLFITIKILYLPAMDGTAQLLLKDHVRVFCALNGARDNPEMEAFNSRFKTENRSLLLRYPDIRGTPDPRVRKDRLSQLRTKTFIDCLSYAVFIASLCHGRNITNPMG